MPIRINFLFDTLRTLGSRIVYGSVLLFYAVCVQAGSVSLAWNANTESSLIGYSLYWGTASGNYSNHVDIPNQTTYTLSNLTDGRTYYFAIKAYGSDSAGQRIESGFSNEVSKFIGGITPPPVTCNPCTIWAAGTVPNVGADPDTSAIEVGVKFKSDVSGVITGIRFYKESTNTGTHVGNLWKSDGTKLASATFSNETASGWQQVNFSSPVPITANTVYVASYHTNTGHYNDTEYAFSGKGVDNGPLHALAAGGTTGANGVYAYGSGSSFPTQDWRSSNYWVDVIFKTQ